MNGHRPPAGAKLSRPRFGYRPGYEGDEIGLGVAVTVAIHAVPVALLFLKALFPHLGATQQEEPVVAKPVVAASLLKLGKPIDPKQLPDRLVPRAREAPHHDIVASRDEPQKKHDVDAGATPPPNTRDSDINRLIQNSQPFAEDGGKIARRKGAPRASRAAPRRIRAGCGLGTCTLPN